MGGSKLPSSSNSVESVACSKRGLKKHGETKVFDEFKAFNFFFFFFLSAIFLHLLISLCCCPRILWIVSWIISQIIELSLIVVPMLYCFVDYITDYRVLVDRWFGFNNKEIEDGEKIWWQDKGSFLLVFIHLSFSDLNIFKSCSKVFLILWICLWKSV